MARSELGVRVVFVACVISLVLLRRKDYKLGLKENFYN
jgi:hypothetical protein